MNFGLWLKYFFHLPHRTAHASADFEAIVAAAFGRNQYKDAELHLVNKLLAESHNFDFLAVQKLLEGGFDPGTPNREIARLCRKMKDETKKPLIVQWEVACGFDQKWYENNFDDIYVVWPDLKPGYFKTYDFAKQAEKILKSLNGKTLALVGHQYHLVRAGLIFKKLGFPPAAVISAFGQFDNNSIQKFTRNKFNWLLREIPVRVHHWFSEYV